MALIGGSKSKSKSYQFTDIDNEVTNTNLQGIEGPAVVGGEGDINFSIATTETDAGAIGEAFGFGERIGGEAFGLADTALGEISAASSRVFDTAAQFARESLGLVERSATAAQKSFEGALDSTLLALDEEQSGGAQRVLYVAAIALAAVVGLGYVLRAR